jgi:hypothetical protein
VPHPRRTQTNQTCAECTLCLWTNAEHFYVGEGEGRRAVGGSATLHRFIDKHPWAYQVRIQRHPVQRPIVEQRIAMLDSLTTGKTWAAQDF